MRIIILHNSYQYKGGEDVVAVGEAYRGKQAEEVLDLHPSKFDPFAGQQ